MRPLPSPEESQTRRFFPNPDKAAGECAWRSKQGKVRKGVLVFCLRNTRFFAAIKRGPWFAIEAKRGSTNRPLALKSSSYSYSNFFFFLTTGSTCLAPANTSYFVESTL